MTTTTTDHDEPLTQTPGMLACPGCGVGTPAPRDAAEVVTVRRAADTPAQRRDGAPVRLARCTDCLTLRDRAAALLDAHPRILARLGSVAAEHAEAALSALVVLALPLPDPATTTQAEVWVLLDRLAVPGSAVGWQSRRPAQGRFQPVAWAHVTEDDRATVRAAYAGVLRDRLARNAPPEGITPPPLDPFDRGTALALTTACLLCGVGAVTVPAAWLTRTGGRKAVALDVWRLMTTSPRSLGGRSGPEGVTGYTCPSCSAAVASVGAVGPTALERALVEHLSATGREAAAQRLRDALGDPGTYGTVPGLLGWGALAYSAHRAKRPATEPNSRPWAHLNLSAVSA
jgi:hypothetical protein